jgi:hypothetical protein
MHGRVLPATLMTCGYSTGPPARARLALGLGPGFLIGATPAGLPWITAAGKTLEKWLAIDMDGTLITAS